jgi:predicted AAA+ superfamily ATPase
MGGLYIHRQIEHVLDDYLKIFPVVAILGPRQCGKSTLVRNVLATDAESTFLDLQDPVDLAKLNDPTLYFASQRDRRICIDEIQFVPELFGSLRSEVDRDRRPGRFVLLGSASRELVVKSSESLAGRIGYLELTPFLWSEIQAQEDGLYRFWNRGGFPDSLLADNDRFSAIWRDNFIRTFLERDIPQLGFQIPAVQFRRFLTLCAHNHGGVLNSSRMGSNLGLSHTTIRRYLDLLEQTFIARTLPPLEVNTKKRLVKSPKLYLRDTGLLHRLLGVADLEGLFGHPVFGASWEGLMIEQVAAAVGDEAVMSHFRTAEGDELDLVLDFPGSGKRLAIECKASSSPGLTKGFFRAVELVQADAAVVVAPAVDAPYPLAPNVQAMGLSDVVRWVKA